MITEIKSPDHYTLRPENIGITKVFLAGSIDQGAASDWQKELVGHLDRTNLEGFDPDIIIMNPRRENWNANLQQTIDDPTFYNQVMWERRYLAGCDLKVFYFSGEGPSPITLLEMGEFATSKDSIVYCPKTFWRHGNVHIFCLDRQIPMVESIKDISNWIFANANF